MAVASSRSDGGAGFGLASILIHAATAALLLGLATNAPPSPPPDEPTVEMAFEPAEVPPPSVEPAAEAPPAPASVTPPPEQLAEQPTSVVPPPEPLSEPPPRLKPPLPKPNLKPPPVRPTQPVQAVPRPPELRPQANTVPAVRTASAPVVPPPAPAATLAIDTSWQASIAGWLLSHKAYPEEARRHGEEGRVVIRFTIDRSGRVLDAAVTGSSGSERLDTATIALLRSAALPAFPATMTQARVTITTSVRYTLQ